MHRVWQSATGGILVVESIDLRSGPGVGGKGETVLWVTPRFLAWEARVSFMRDHNVVETGLGKDSMFHFGQIELWKFSGRWLSEFKIKKYLD